MPRLASYRVGAGDRPTLLLHGFLGAGKNLRSLAQLWAEREPSRLFLIPDLTGHGASPPLPAKATLITLAGDVLETADAEGFSRPFSIVGHSLGGRVALAVANLAPGSVDEIVLLDITPGPIDDRLSASRRALAVLLNAPDDAPDRRTLRQSLIDGGLSPGMADWLVMNVAVESGRYRWTFDRRALDRLQSVISADDLWPIVEARVSAVRCIRGELSHYVDDADIRRFQAAGCRVDTLAGAGHELHVDKLVELVDALVREA